MVPDEIRYAQIGENLRFIGDMRFKQLSLLMAVLSLIGAGLATNADAQIAGSISARTGLCGLALLFTAVTWVMEVRSTLHWAAQREAAPELWPRHTSIGLFRWLNATTAVLGFLAAVYGFWLYCAWQWKLHPLLFTAFSLLGVLLVAFSIWEYGRKLWTHTDQTSRISAGGAT